MAKHLRIAVDQRIMTITFDRPEARNALTHDMYGAIAEGLAEAGHSDAVRCVILTGEGGVFTAGNDLGDFGRPLPERAFPAIRFLETLRDLDMPVIAAVNGPAIGIGLTMLLHCDLVYASTEATFSAPFARLGLVPEAGSSLLLPRALGMAWANDILLAGRVLDASDALVSGLVSRVVPAEELGALAWQVATQLAAFAPNAVRESKRLIRADRGQIAERMNRELPLFKEQLRSSEFTESLLAMKEKRAPSFE